MAAKLTLSGILRAILRADRALLNDPAWVADALQVIDDLEGHAAAAEVPDEGGAG